MTRRCSLLLFALPFLLLTAPTQAQEVDTTKTDAPAPADTVATDTSATDAMPPDTAAGEPAVSDTAQAAAPDTTMADSLTTAADTMGADTTLVKKSPEARAKEQAQEAAESWLSFTDAGEFGKSWDAAAPPLQEGISREAWLDRGAKARSSLDTLRSRTLTRAQYQDSTAQLPTGDPVVTLQYRSEFEGGSVLEAVVTTKQDSLWKVAGYRIVPAPKSAQATDTTSTDIDTTSTDTDSTAQ
jgi:hypothetical protein